MIGHTAPVEVAMFSPHIYKRSGKEELVCVLGSQDNGVSVWATGSPRAIVALEGLFRHSVLDIAW